MPHCMVPGCTNCSQRCGGRVSFHRIPSDQKTRKIWVNRIPRVNPRPVAYSYVCSDHFTEDAFEVSFMEQLTGEKQRRRLRTGAIPTIFSRRSPMKSRKNSEARLAEQAKYKVSRQ